MAKIKLLGLETHYRSQGNRVRTHGVDFARIVNPLTHLKNHPDFEVEIRKNPLGEGNKESSWKEITEKFDILYTSYIDSPGGYVQMALLCRKNGTAYVTDVDDNLWEVPKHSPTHQTYHYGTDQLDFVSLALQDTPYVTTTNQYLKYKLVKYLAKPHAQIKTLPNYIDLELYDYKKIPPKQNKDEIVIGYFGTNTHTRDVMQLPFARAMEKIMREHKNVYFETTGFFIPQLKALWKRQYRHRLGEPDFMDWVRLWGEIMSTSDIVVSPLEETDFNRSKSNIKLLEFSAAKKPGVYQDIRQYSEMVKHSYNGFPTGFLARSEMEWYKHLKSLVESESLRRQIGSNAYNYVKDNHTIQGNIEEYANYFKHVYETHKKMGNLLNEGFILPGKEVISAS